MSNIEKAAEILSRLDRARDGRPSNAFIAHYLSHAGLLAPDLPEPEIIDDSPYWEVVEQITATDGRVWGEFFDSTPAEARAQALALLAAANYAEEKK